MVLDWGKGGYGGKPWKVSLCSWGGEARAFRRAPPLLKRQLRGHAGEPVAPGRGLVEAAVRLRDDDRTDVALVRDVVHAHELAEAPLARALLESCTHAG